MRTQSCTPAPMAMGLAAPWSELPDDVLTTVASLLPSVADLLRFRAVCRSWRRAAAACAPPPLPYLMFSSKADALTRCLYSISDGRIHRVKFPEEARSWRCCGSSHGWLAMADLVDAGVCLFNPISGARLDLPPLTTLPQVLHVVTGPETDTYAGVYGRPSPDVDGDCTYPWYVVDSTEGYPWRWTPEELRDDLVQKVVASRPVTASDPSDCTVMVLYNDYKVAYARPGDESWTSLTGGRSSPYWYRDLLYHDNKFYLLTVNYSVWAVDFAGAARRDPRMEDLAPKREEAFLKGEVFWSYLSAASGAVLLVHRRLYRESHPRRTEAFQVWKLEVVREGGSRWVEAEDLGGCTLFLGAGGDCSTSVGGGGGCAPDSVYFAADNLEFCDPDEESECVLEGGTYHLKGGASMEALLPAGCDDIGQHPVWISPSIVDLPLAVEHMG